MPIPQSRSTIRGKPAPDQVHELRLTYCARCWSRSQHSNIQPVTRIDDKGDTDCLALTRIVSGGAKPEEAKGRRSKKRVSRHALSVEYSHILGAEASSVRQFKV